MSIDKFTTIDRTDTKPCFASDIARNIELNFVAKVVGFHSRRQLACNKKIALLQRFLNEIIKSKPDVLMGQKVFEMHSSFMCAFSPQVTKN